MKPVDSSIKSNEIPFSTDLLSGILSFNSFLDMESVKTISPNVEINE